MGAHPARKRERRRGRAPSADSGTGGGGARAPPFPCYFMSIMPQRHASAHFLQPMHFSWITL